MHQLQVDPATGFLQSPSPTGIYNFDAERKTQLISLAMECAENGAWPNIPKLCKSVGIATQTFYTHVKNDEEFASQWQEVKRTLSSGIAVDMREHAKRPGNYMDRVTLLRHLYPEEWGGPERNQVSVDLGWIKKLAETMQASKSTIIDAEVVQKPGITSAQKPIDASQ